MEELHTSMTGANISVKKLTYSLFPRVWWPKLHAFVRKFIAVCGVCKKTKDSTSLTASLLHPLLIYILMFTSLIIDFVVTFLYHKVTMLYLCMWIVWQNTLSWSHASWRRIYWQLSKLHCCFFRMCYNFFASQHLLFMIKAQDSPVYFGNPCGNYLDHVL